MEVWTLLTDYVGFMALLSIIDDGIEKVTLKVVVGVYSGAEIVGSKEATVTGPALLGALEVGNDAKDNLDENPLTRSFTSGTITLVVLVSSHCNGPIVAIDEIRYWHFPDAHIFTY